MNTYAPIRPGDHVKVEHTIGQATGTPTTRTIEGRAYRDSEGVVRVGGSDVSFPPNLERDDDGYFRDGVILISHREAPMMGKGMGLTEVAAGDDTAPVPCPTCDGRPPRFACPTCYGTGAVEDSEDIPGMYDYPDTGLDLGWCL